MTKNKETVETEIVDEEIEQEQEPILEDTEGKEQETDFKREMPTNTLDYASIIARESQVKSNFKQVPKEVRYSFYDGYDKREVMWKSEKYADLNYLSKSLKLQAQEDKDQQLIKLSLYKVTNEDELAIYFKKLHKYRLFLHLKNQGKIQEIIDFVKNLKTHGEYNDIYNFNTSTN
jgi:hypothetical protein